MEFTELPTEGLTPEQMIKLANQYITHEYCLMMDRLARESECWVRNYGRFLN